MKKADNLHKSRYGRVSNKRKFNEELDASLSVAYRKMDCILPKRTNEKSSNNNSMSDEKGITYNVGDMVWAKTGKYPVWPGIVISDPETNTFSKKENMVAMLHIYYCNDAYRRNWIKYKQVSKFSGKDEILSEIPKITTQISRSKLKAKWNQAVDEAECLAAIKQENRVKLFFNSKGLASTSLLNNKVESSTEHPTTNRQPNKLANNHNGNQKVVSNHEEQTLVFQKNISKENPRTIIPELCKQFYSNGWVTGTGGGISIKYNDQIFIAPSGVQKERIEPDDIFVQDLNGVDIEVPPAEKNLSKSQCTPIFMCSYIVRNAGAVIHVHSQEVVKLCLLNPEKELRITGLEMIKGIFNEETGKCYDNDDVVIIPIIENSKYERDLVDTFKLALAKYPSTSAVLVRNHGMYVWGRDWVSAKTQLECYEYLFKIMVFKKTHHV